MRSEGPDFLTKNSQLAEKRRRTFVDIDEMEKELKKAAKAIESAKELAATCISIANKRWLVIEETIKIQAMKAIGPASRLRSGRLRSPPRCYAAMVPTG